MGRSEGAPHLGIILDGNRRYALDVLLWCAELSIPAVTLWVLSTENFQRTPTEVSGILSAGADPPPRRARARRRQARPPAGLPALRHPGGAGGDGRPPGHAAHDRRRLRRPPGDHRRRAGAAPRAGQAGRGPGHAPSASTRPTCPTPTSSSAPAARSGSRVSCDVHWPAFRRIDFLRAVRSFQQRERRFRS